mmetsp:Transcript_69585/g.111316  ORF Transcript_69585/g.111316 Transcript_69585/m.111316 type:complete len:85 (-) Transcript_69585:378-632(-)
MFSGGIVCPCWHFVIWRAMQASGCTIASMYIWGSQGVRSRLVPYPPRPLNVGPPAATLHMDLAVCDGFQKCPHTVLTIFDLVQI